MILNIFAYIVVHNVVHLPLCFETTKGSYPTSLIAKVKYKEASLAYRHCE